MKTKIVFPVLLLGALFLYGCSAEEQEEIVDRQQKPILLSTDGTLSLQTKSPDNFPNSKTIVVTATEYTSGGEDWTSYLDIQNETATATSYDSGEYGFSWSQQKYWPMEDEELIFIAYSPVANTSSVKINDDNTSLSLTLQENMPDVLFAEKNAERGPYKKTGLTSVTLGEFQHALTKLTVKVERDGEMSEDIRLTTLQVINRQLTAQVDLLQKTTATTTQIASEPLIFHLVKDGNINFYNTTYTNSVLVFPDTQESTEIHIELDDSGLKYKDTFTMEQFKKNNESITYQTGKEVVLTLYVKGTPVDPAETGQNITLDGQLEDWDDKGDYEVVIK